MKESLELSDGVVWEGGGCKLGFKNVELKDDKWGMILPQIIAMGTIVRRAMEETWLTEFKKQPSAGPRPNWITTFSEVACGPKNHDEELDGREWNRQDRRMLEMTRTWKFLTRKKERGISKPCSLK